MNGFLQAFDFRSSSYGRPQERWLCGRAAEGHACRLGPDARGHCRVRFECEPGKRGGRWFCTRPPSDGGACADGPRPDGTCCRAMARCVPVPSLRSRRGAAVRWVTVLTVGVLLLFLGGPLGPEVVSPGALTFQHAEIKGCGNCHAAFDAGPAGWPRAAFLTAGAVPDSRLCLSCHALGKDALAPHGRNAPTLVALTAAVRPASLTGTEGLVSSLAARLGAPPDTMGGTVACATCHREHRGQNAHLTAAAETGCQVCHRTRFDSFARGHPEFGAYPYRRRTRIAFDHASHFGKHFKDERTAAKAPATCTACHRAAAGSGRMATVGFETACAACHTAQIEGAGRAGPAGIPVLVVPGLDLEVLKERGVPIGEWPEYADAELTPVTALLLRGSEDFAPAAAGLGDLDLMDLSAADDSQIAAAGQLAWALKGLLYDILTRGTPAVSEALARALGRPPPAGQASRLLAQLPVDVVRAAQVAWFPNLIREVSLYRAGVMPPAAADDRAAAEPAGDALPEGPEGVAANGDILSADEGDILSADEGDILSADEGDILSGDEGDILSADEGDILAEDEGDILAEDEGDILAADEGDILGEDDENTAAAAREGVESAALEALPALPSDEAWMVAGGWFRDEFSLAYRPGGHGDGFLRAWLDLGGDSDLGAARAVFEVLANPLGPGACMKCHSIDRVGGTVLRVNWSAAPTEPGRQEFTRFSHRSHFSLLGAEGCGTCHVVDKGADYQAGFKDRDPQVFASNFQPIPRAVCATCHTEKIAGNGCVMCHNYHVGILPPDATRVTTRMGAAAK